MKAVFYDADGNKQGLVRLVNGRAVVEGKVVKKFLASGYKPGALDGSGPVEPKDGVKYIEALQQLTNGYTIVQLED